MYVVCVTVKVVPGQGEAFSAATQKNHEGTRQEPGNLRFDVLRAESPVPGEPEAFFLYEVYHTPADFAAHQQTPHFFEWREAVAPMMAEPRQREIFVSVYPDPWA